jgi:hypothetical protein
MTICVCGVLWWTAGITTGIAVETGGQQAPASRPAQAPAGAASAPPAARTVETYRQKVRTFHTADDFRRLAPGVKIHRTLDLTAEMTLRRAVSGYPALQFTLIAPESNSVTWIGTPQGAIRLSVDARSGTMAKEFFSGRRWLPDDRVAGVAFDKEAVWIETPKGFAKIAWEPMTLEDKSRVFVERIQARHNRWGLTADSRLRTAGDVKSNQTVSTDNDGLWTAMYVAAESFRYAVTKAPDAQANARTGMQALMRLEAITGIPGFPARSFIKKGVDEQPSDGEWHDTRDGVWRWKGDTSSDEIVGHYFVYPIYDALVADDVEKVAIRSLIDRITNHIIDNGYHLVDVDGKPTRWGWWAPNEIWQDADETGLRALHLVSHLQVAIHLAGSPANRAKYQAAYDDLIKTHRYHLLTRNQKIVVPGGINHSDDELAFMSFYPLLQYEKDPALREVYRESLQRSWQIERPERNPLWNIIYAAGMAASGAPAKEFDRAESLRTLREIPMDQIEWNVRNSIRADVPIDPMADRQGRHQALVVLPYDELPMTKWNGNPFNLDGGVDGKREDDGAYFLLPYWMGRYHKLIDQ